jgi:WD40 repeat protein
VVSPDGTRSVTWGFFDKTVRMWDLANGRQVWACPGDAVETAAISPDNQRVVVFREHGVFVTHDARTGAELQRDRLPFDRITHVAFSPDGTRIAGAFRARGVVWLVADPQQHAYLDGHTYWVNGVAFAPGGKEVLTAGSDGTVRLWEADSGREVRCFAGHAGPVVAVGFFPDGQRFVSAGSTDRRAKVWPTAGVEVYRTLDPRMSAVLSLAFSPNGSYLLATDFKGHQARLLALVSGECVRTFKGHAESVQGAAFSADGQRVITGSRDATIKLWDTATGQEQMTVSPQTGDAVAVAFAPDGRTFLAVTVEYEKRVQQVSVWDAATGTARWSETGPAFAAYSPDGLYVLAANSLKEAATGQTVREFAMEATRGAFSPDGKSVVLAGTEATVRLYEVDTAALVRDFVGHTGFVSAVGFSPDGTRVFTGSHDQTARIWDMATGRELVMLRGSGTRVFSVAWSENGRFVALGHDGARAISVFESLPATTTLDDVQEWKRARYAMWLQDNLH